MLFEGPKGKINECVSRISQIIGYIPKTSNSAEAKADAERKDLTVPTIRQALFFPDPTGQAYDTFLCYLKSAKKTIDVACFTISAQEIFHILLLAHKSGVRVRILTDNDTVSNKGSDVKALAEAGVDVRLDGVLGEGESNRDHGASSLMHHKYCVLDSLVLINGSFNWTSTAASLNAENMMITNEKFFVEAYEAHFNATFDHFAKHKLK